MVKNLFFPSWNTNHMEGPLVYFDSVEEFQKSRLEMNVSSS